MLNSYQIQTAIDSTTAKPSTFNIQLPRKGVIRKVEFTGCFSVLGATLAFLTLQLSKRSSVQNGTVNQPSEILCNANVASKTTTNGGYLKTFDLGQPVNVNDVISLFYDGDMAGAEFIFAVLIWVDEK